MDCKLKNTFQKSISGMSLIEVMVVLLLLTMSFLIFLQALNTGKEVRTKSELRTVQAVLLNSLEQEIRSRRFDENIEAPWSTSLGLDTVSNLLSFDGVNDEVLLGDINALDAPSEFSVSFWFKRIADLSANSNHATSNIMYAKASDPYNDNIEIGTDGPLIEIYIDSQQYDGTQSHNAGIQNNIWYHFALTYKQNDSQEVKLYINGTNIKSWSVWGGNLDNSDASPLTIGNTDHIETPFRGFINEFAIWGNALSYSEVSTIYNSGNALNVTINYSSYSSASNLIGYWRLNEGTGSLAIDASGNNNMGILQNNPSWIQDPISEGSKWLWDDIDDFHNYSIESIPEYPAFGSSVFVNYIDSSNGFSSISLIPTNYKSVTVRITHKTLSALIDTMIITPGI